MTEKHMSKEEWSIIVDKRLEKLEERANLKTENLVKLRKRIDELEKKVDDSLLLPTIISHGRDHTSIQEQLSELKEQIEQHEHRMNMHVDIDRNYRNVLREFLVYFEENVETWEEGSQKIKKMIKKLGEGETSVGQRGSPKLANELHHNQLTDSTPSQVWTPPEMSTVLQDKTPSEHSKCMYDDCPICHPVEKPSVLDTMERMVAEALDPDLEYAGSARQTESIEDGIINAFNKNNETEYKLVAKDDVKWLIAWSQMGINAEPQDVVDTGLAQTRLNRIEKYLSEDD
jgi:hypothetical protein